MFIKHQEFYTLIILYLQGVGALFLRKAILWS